MKHIINSRSSTLPILDTFPLTATKNKKADLKHSCMWDSAKKLDRIQINSPNKTSQEVTVANVTTIIYI